jgi:DNA-binding beta-propeller fold protein YncE
MLSRKIRNRIRAAIVVLAFVATGLVLSTSARRDASAHPQPTTPSSSPPAYTLFESGQVRPLALSPDRTQLFAVNTPAGTVEVFDISHAGLSHRASVPVGLEPISVAARTDSELWVVNHLSDSISIVNVGRNEPNRVTRTLLVGDEPRDIVFAGPQKRRAFITTAHRGQNSPIDPQLTTPGIGRADVWVFDALSLGNSLGGSPLTIITLFSDTPRALAVSPDGSRVYAAAFASGSRTTTVHEAFVPDGGEAAGGTPAPNTNHAGVHHFETGLIVKFNGSHWVDELGRTWDDSIKFNLPDKDVFVINAMAGIPKQFPGPNGFFSGVGTILYNMIVNPANGKVYVTNTEARNENRFAGPGNFAHKTVQGHFAENRITVLKPGPQTVTPRHLNRHIDFNTCCAPLPNLENEHSLALPQGMAISENGQTLYVAAQGSDKIGVFNTNALEQNTFTPGNTGRIHVSGGGPTGVVLDEQRERVYALTRFDNGISIIDTQSRSEIAHLPMFNPEPASVTAGRRFLYDAARTSSHGDSSCASCHVGGDTDQLAWDLGDPDGDVRPATGPFRFIFDPTTMDLHPMKGPMVTQSLRGMANHGPMHWRGDRTGGFNEPSAQPDSGSFDEQEAFRQFNEAFVGLMGRSSQIAPAEMQAFTDFALQITYPPNPIRALDNSLTPDEQTGRDLYFNKPATLGMKCNFCHVLNPQGNAEFGVVRPGFFGSDGTYVGGELPQTLKIPQFRNLYTKVGMFGFPRDILLNPDHSDAHTGDQIRGFGFTHSGAIPSPFQFLSALGFVFDDVIFPNPDGFPRNEEGIRERRQVEAFLMAFDSNMAPIVGQQLTLRLANAGIGGPRVNLLIARAVQGECDLVVHGRLLGEMRGYVYRNGRFTSDKANRPTLSAAALRLLALVPGQELTFTAVPPGSGLRMGIDRDLDGVLNGDE